MKLVTRPAGPKSRRAAARGQVLAAPAGAVPSDPHAILVKRPRGSGRRPGVLIVLVGLAIAAEIFAPSAWKPSQIAGDAAARFYFSIMTADNMKQTELVEQYMVTQRLAERELEYSAWIGRCNIVAQFDFQAGAACRQAADAFYRQAIADARRARDRMDTGSFR